MKAKYIKDIVVDNINGRLYNLSKAIEEHTHIIVMAFISPGYLGEPMTLILPSNEHGEILSWHDLEGSQLGVLDYNRVLNDLGYIVEV